MWIVVAFSAIFVLVGIFVINLGIRDLIRAKASVAWPTSPGKVQSSSVVEERGDEGGLIYHAEVVYEYNVNNTTFSGKRIAYGDYGTSNPSLRAQEIVNCHPQDKNVTVSYMPNNPKECLLEVGAKGHAFIWPAIGYLFFNVGISMAAFFVPVFGLILLIIGLIFVIFGIVHWSDKE